MTEPYSRSSAYYDALHESRDYLAQTARLRRLLDETRPGASSVLDVACGTGRHLALLGGEYDRVGTDLSQEMLDVARRACPDVAFECQDMAELSLGRDFDVVMCLFSSVAYMQTTPRLDQAVSAMARHVAPGGVLLVEPWFTPEQYWEGHLAVNHARSGDLDVTWMYVQERRDGLSRLEIHYLAGSPRGVEHWVETHEVGLFTDEEYRSSFSRAGLAVDLQPEGVSGRGVYIGRRHPLTSRKPC